VIIDVFFEDAAPIPPAVMLQALRFLTFTLESNLKGRPIQAALLMAGSMENGRHIRALHFHTDGKGRPVCAIFGPGEENVGNGNSSDDQDE